MSFGSKHITHTHTPHRLNRFQIETNMSKSTKKYETCAWTPNKVFIQFPSLGKWQASGNWARQGYWQLD